MQADIVKLARDWIGTPYQHQCSVRGVGADCLGLVLGVCREIGTDLTVNIPPYSLDWSEVSKCETLLNAADSALIKRDKTALQHGNVLVFRMRKNAIAKHLAIFALRPSGERIIHAYSGRGVVETPLSPLWKRRIVGVYQIPDRRK